MHESVRIRDSYLLYIFFSLVPPDIQIEDSGKSVAPLKMEIIGSRQKTEVNAVT